MEPLISIITVNFNGFDLTCSMIDSVLRHEQSDIEIIAVDNGSARDEAALLSEKYGTSVVIVRSEKNLGFAGGNNLGIKKARGKFLFFLNNDTEIKSGCIGALAAFLEENPDAGIVCPKIKFYYDPDVFQFAGFTPLTPITLRNRLIGYGEKDEGQFNEARVIPYAHGAAMMVRRSALLEAGPMPEEYFLYFEELDWSLRFAEKHWRIWFCPDCTIYHKESATTGKDSPLRRKYLTRNKLLFARRNRKGVIRILCYFWQICVSDVWRIIRYTLSGKKEYARAVCTGIREFTLLK